MKYLKVKAVRDFIREQDRRVGKDFLITLDCFIEERLAAACRLHNGGKKTLDSSVAPFAGIKLKG